MSETSTTPTIGNDQAYTDLERIIGDRIGRLAGPLFETDADPAALWGAYLEGIPEDNRQHYNCHACRRFVQQYGGIALISDDGISSPALWDADEVPEFFRPAVAALSDLVRRARVTGVFLSSDRVWGTPRTGEWGHLAGVQAKPFSDRLRTAGQAMAEKRQDFGILSHGLSDYPADAVRQAVRVLNADALYRSEKALGVADWFLGLHARLEGVKGPRRANLIWAAVATAPPGFCHVRSTMISTLLDDIVAGLDFDTISRRWSEKMHPLRYQRPQAAPKAGAIEQAERLVEQLGVAPSLERRFATLDDVLASVWSPREAEPESPKAGGVFDHLRQDRARVKELDLPTVAMTWEKFARTVLPAAESLEVRVPGRGGFYGLVTAVHPDAPALLQWDGLGGHARNPVSWYFYHNGSSASQWGLTAGAWVSVTRVFLSPHQWQEPQKFAHQGVHAFFALEGCRDSRTPGLALFPETLRAEFHGIRSVIEAHSRRGAVQGADQGDANGIAIRKGGTGYINLRVRTSDGSAIYSIDRWD